MNIFIGYRSAYRYWRTSDPPSDANSTRMHPSAGACVEKADLASLDLEKYGITDQPLHLAMAAADDRCRAKGYVSHVWAGSVPSGAYVKLDKGLYISSPNESFIEMAHEVSLVELVRFGYVLCSSYAHVDDEKHGFRKREPLTTVQSLKKFVAKSAGHRGRKKATRALRFIADTSASPMETNLVMALCLPRMLGGYGLDLPELNPCIKAQGKGLVERDHFSCDLYWRAHRTAVEYDSDEYHSGPEAETRDSARRSALLSQGVTVVTITPDQFFDARKLDEAARAVAKLTGKRLPSNDASWMMRRHRLRSELLEDMRHG